MCVFSGVYMEGRCRGVLGVGAMLRVQVCVCGVVVVGNDWINQVGRVKGGAQWAYMEGESRC